MLTIKLYLYTEDEGNWDLRNIDVYLPDRTASQKTEFVHSHRRESLKCRIAAIVRRYEEYTGCLNFVAPNRFVSETVRQNQENVWSKTAITRETSIPFHAYQVNYVRISLEMRAETRLGIHVK